MDHPLRIWLKAKKKSVQAFSDGQPFSYPTVYKLLKAEGTFSVDTLIDIAAATGNEVSVETLIETLREQRKSKQAPAEAVQP